MKVEHTLRERIGVLAKEDESNKPMKEIAKQVSVKPEAPAKELIKAKPVEEKVIKKVKSQELLPDFDTLNKKRVKELLEYAQEHGVEIPPNTKKVEIIQMIIYQLDNKRKGGKNE